MKRLTRAALAAAVVMGATVAGALPATAHDKGVVTVEKNSTIDQDIAAGDACSFPTNIQGRYDLKTITYKSRTVTIYSHASARVTNLDNHKSATFNVNVRFVDKTLSNGDLASTSRGNALFFGTHIGFSKDAGPAFLYVRGKSSWTTIDPSDDGGAYVFHKIKGQVTNVCDLID